MRSLRLAIVIKHAGFLRYIQTQVEELCRRGHHIHLAIQDAPIEDEDGLLELLSARYPSISVGYAVSRRDGWAGLAGDLRGALDYCRYIHPDYAGADGLRKRMLKGAGRLGVAIDATARLLGVHKSATLASLMMGVLRNIHSSIPPDPDILAYVRQLDLDLLLVTGLVWPRGGQADYVLACRKLGVPTGYIVNSWDNLTNKGDIKAVPDAVYVWNAEQRREAERHHGVPRRDVRITGAALFDRWFDRTTTESRAGFCRRVGLPGDGPFLLYACSSPAIAPNKTEPAFFRNWLLTLRNSADERLAKVNVLVRPHPFNTQVWSDFEAPDPGVALYPRHGRWIVQEEDRNDYYHALRYCSAVVGINTSAMVEAAILGARTLSIRSGKFEAMQDGTLHFHHLTSLGIVQIHANMDEHLGELAKLVETAPDDDRPSIPGVLSFVRPQGPEKSSTAVAVAAIERQARTGKSRRRWLVPVWWPLMALGLEVATLARLLTPAKAATAGAKTDASDPRNPPTALQRFYGRHVFPRLLAQSLKLLGSPGVRDVISKQLSGGELNRFSEVEAGLAEAVDGEGPIFIGPWLSEVGFEILYWIPFLRWWRKHARVDKSRLVIISRGGAKFWYSGVLGDYVDVFDLYSPAEFRAKNLSRSAEVGHQKQSRVSEMDVEIYEEVARRLGVERYTILHPWILYRLFTRYWKGLAGLDFVNNYTRYEALKLKPSRVEKACAGLPKRFVAVKFYFRESLPDSPANRAFIADVVGRIAEHIDVVLLSSEVRLDDHSDFSPAVSQRIHRVDHMTKVSENLDFQSHIIARSEAFVGTYGGLSYVARCLGKTSICFEALPQYNRPIHTELAMRKLRDFEGGLHILRPEDLDYFQWLLANVAAPPATRPAAAFADGSS